MDETVEIKRNIFGVLTGKSRRALIRQQKEREEQKRKMLAGGLPKDKPKKVTPPKKLALTEMPATSMTGHGEVSLARLEIYSFVLRDLDERAKEMKANGGFGTDRLAATKWRNNKLKWWRAVLGLDEKGNPL